MKNLTIGVSTGKFAVVATVLLITSVRVVAMPVTLHCTINKNQVSSARDWVVDITARTIDGHRVGDKVTTVGGAYNEYFITDTEIGFATSTGIRHSISRTDGIYKAFGMDGKLIWTGSCSPLLTAS
ncbi:MAG TPA: hypothetical protein VIF82_05555 [Burkholderiaceae bacterium]|jgi:hypothetical protein